VSALLAPLFARRGVASAAEVERFLAPSLDDLHDPLQLLGMSEAVSRLLEAREAAEPVAVVGDYDVDGVSGTALLVASLEACGIDTVPILPNRLVDGYGFQEAQVARARGRGCGLIVTVDCGTGSHEAVQAAREAGIDVVITDHHLPTGAAPDGAVQVNPRQEGCEYPFPELCGAGLAFKLAQALGDAGGRPLPLDALTRVACLGTIADLVPLVGENRIIASIGLAELRRTRSCGLRALMQSAGVTPPVQASDVGFRLGPRLNAAGRLRSPDEALELLLTRDSVRAAELAAGLEECNRERQAQEQQVVDEARALFVEREPRPGILLGWSEQWHRGVVGIAASRIARELHRPTLLLSVDGATSVGSGRSISGISLYDFLDPFRSRFERFGGHDQAVGLSVATDDLEGIRAELERAAVWPEELLRRRREYEIELRAEQVDDELFEQLRVLQPHGIGNPHPVLRVGPLEMSGAIRSFGRGHRKGRASGDEGGRINLLAWGRRDGTMLSLEGRFEVLGRLEWDTWIDAPVLQVSDSRPVGAASP
jgi:single-stranded-DNA-specific exonuclease